MKKIFLFLFVVLAFGAGIVFGKNFLAETKNIDLAIEDKYTKFVDEVYGVIMDNYWNILTEEQLTDLFVLATENITGTSATSKKSRSDFIKTIGGVIERYDNDAKKREFVLALGDLVLSNLEPFGRSRLYSHVEEKALSDTVTNKTEENRYEDLGVDKNAKSEEIEKAYEEESKKWDPTVNKSPEAPEKFEKIQQAYKTLSDPVSKNNYDIAGVEPTIDYQLISDDIFYVHLKKFSPNSFDEIQRVFDKVAGRKGLNSLILDLSGNIGGAIDGLPYFLGPFIGNNQHAYQFLSRGKTDDYKTKIGWLPSLVQYKKVVILIDENSQSTAEVMASVLKKYNVGILLGRKTKGWGTVERVFPLKTKFDENESFSAFLVHTLTLREDGLTIEGNGVEPLISLDDKNWKSQLLEYFDSQSLVSAVEKVCSR